MKKLLIILLLLIVMLPLSGCTKYKSTVPNLDKWDNNYIYVLNKKSKTDGSDEEILFESINYNDTQYKIYDFIESSFINDVLYFAFKACDINDNYIVGIAKYDLKTRTLKPLHISETLKSLFFDDVIHWEYYSYITLWYYNDEYLVTGDDYFLLRISLYDDSVIMLEDFRDYIIEDDCIYMENKLDNNIYSCDISSFTPNKIMEYGEIYGFNVMDIDGVKAIIFRDENKNIFAHEIISKKQYIIYQNNDKKIFNLSNYLIIGDMNKYKYAYNAVLYRYKYNNSVILEGVYSFGGEYVFKKAEFIDSNIIKLIDIDDNNFYFNISKNKLFSEFPKELMHETGTLHTCGEYTYYVEEFHHSFYAIMYKSIILKRKDKNGSIVNMQFYSSHQDYDKNKFHTSSFLTELKYLKKDQVLITSIDC